MRKYVTRGICILMASVMVLGTGMTAFAAEDTSAEEAVVVEEGDRPYLALGEDLTDDQRAVVLDLLGVDEDKLDDYDVVYITNKQEHKYLGDYISADKIGTKSLSSVVVMAADEGSGVNVTTHNINYCTTGMYENAMVTAGITDADVIVAAPTEISGTAALLGVIEAYSVMTGKKIKDKNIDAALNEMVITGEIQDSTGETEEIEGMIAYLKEEVIDGNISSDSDLESLIKQAEEKFGITLTDEEVQQLIDLLKKISKLDLDINSLKNQAQEIYNKLSDLNIDIDTDELASQAEGIFAKLIAAIKEFFAQFGK